MLAGVALPPPAPSQGLVPPRLGFSEAAPLDPAGADFELGPIELSYRAAGTSFTLGALDLLFIQAKYFGQSSSRHLTASLAGSLWILTFMINVVAHWS